MAELGDVVRINYAGRLEDGREFESSWRTGEPLDAKLGSGRLLPQVEQTLCEMLPGERRTLRLAPERAYGIYDETLIQTIPLDRLPNADQLPVGDYIEIKTARGTIRAKVLSVGDNGIVLDLNHELAGETVIFDLELLAIIHETAIHKELHPEGCTCGCDRLKEQIG